MPATNATRVFQFSWPVGGGCKVVQTGTNITGSWSNLPPGIVSYTNDWLPSRFFRLINDATYNLVLTWSFTGQPAGFRVWQGFNTNTYSLLADCSNHLSLSVSNLNAGVTYYWSVSPYDSSGSNGVMSPPVSYYNGVLSTNRLTIN